MCGISLIIRKNKDNQDGAAAIRRMAEAQAHRGPDGKGFHYLNWENEELWFGHNLLSLSGNLESSRQPMLTEDGHCGLIFNGEIYNAPQLRSVLEESGQVFRGDSDTEVLLYWIRKQGRRGLSALHGMFAFIFWDSRKKLLIIHRDGSGIKPLYFSRNRNYLIFASEPAAMFASGLFDYHPDTEAIRSYLNYKFIPAPLTAWQGMQQLLPGECLEYWESKPMQFGINAPDFPPPRNLQEAMDEAFSAVIPASRPFGIALSGGIDSGLILAWCVRQGLKPALFSIRFAKGSSSWPDTRAAEEMAARFGLSVNWVDSGPEDFLEITRCLHPWDILVADSALVLTRKLSEAARIKGIPILLSGAGADEYFGGYRRHAFFKNWIALTQSIPEPLKKFFLSAVRFGKLAWNNLSGDSTEALWQAAVSSRLNAALGEQEVLPLPAGHTLENMLEWDRRCYLTNDVLCISDLAGMSEGIEMRFPFLHPSMTSFASSVPLEERMGDGRKEMLRDEFRKYFGNNLADRPKQGFGISLPEFLLRKESGSYLEKTLQGIVQEKDLIRDPVKWKYFCLKALTKPAAFLPEWILLGRLDSWLKHYQKPTEDAAFPSTP
jgi:asparagine synthase (glutamine-hydrolysing)